MSDAETPGEKIATDTPAVRARKRVRVLVMSINALSMLIAAGIVVIALYVLAAGQLLALLPDRRADVAQWLGERLDMRVEIDRIDAGMNLLTPVVRLQGVRLYVRDAPQVPALVAPVIDLEVAALSSLWARQPVLDLLRLQGIDLTIEETDDGHFRVKGMPFRVNDPDAAERLRQALRVIYTQKHIVVERARVSVESERLPFTAFSNIQLHMHNDGDTHQVSGAVTVLGQGNLPLSFVMQFSGTPLLPADIVADIYLRAQPASLEGWLPRRDLGEDVWIDALAGGGEVWLKLARGRVDDVRGRVQIDSMSASLGDGSKVEGVLGLTSRFHWRDLRTPAERLVDGQQDWTLTLGQLNFRRQGRAWPEADAALAFRRNAGGDTQVRAAMTRGSIEMLAGFSTLLSPQRTTWPATIARLAPQGQLRDVRVDWDSAAAPESQWHVSAGFTQTGWRADAGVPGLSGVSGRVDAVPDTGFAQIVVQNGQLQLPAQYAEPLVLDDAALRVVWQRDAGGWLLRSNRFTLRNADARASGLLTLALPGKDASPVLNLLALIEDGRGAATSRYLPSTTSAGVRDWLGSALQEGHLRRGSFLFHGPVRHDDASLAARTFQMRFEGDGIALAFLPTWPALKNADADVFIANGHVDARARSARLLDSALDAIHVTVTPGSGPAQLDISAHVDGELGNAFTLFRDTSLRTSMPAELLRWDGSGRLDAKVMVSMPLAGSGEQRVTVESSVSGGSLSSTQHQLEVGDVSGNVRYDTRDGFSARDLRGSALGTVLTGSARTTGGNAQDGSRAQQTVVDLRGRLRMQQVSSWLRLPVLDVLRGDADAAMTLRFGAGTDSVMEVRSDLRGIASTAPAPLGKSADAAVDTRFSWTLGTEKPRMTLAYGKALAADVTLEDGASTRGAISLGNARLPAADGRGLVIEGATAMLSVPDWLAFLRRMVDAPAVATSKAAAHAAAARDTPVARTVAGIAALGDRLQRANITVERMETGSLPLDSATVKIIRDDDNGFRVAIASRQVDGTLSVPADYRVGDERLLDVKIDQFTLPATGTAQNAATGVSPLAIPALKLTARNLRVGSDDYGAWELECVPQADGVMLRNVRGNWRALEISGQGVWRVEDGAQRTQFSGVASTVDIAKVSEAFGFEPNISSAGAKVDVELAWPGRPDNIDIPGVKGQLTLNLRAGRFVTASAKSQALRAFGVFNLGTWQRRMKLDFTDLYKRGVAFDTLTGALVLDAGHLATDNLVAKGPAAMFEVSGSTELSSHALDTRVRVTLPVNSNLYVGCLAGLAACAGIVAFEQFWGDRLEKLTTLSYDVRGTWEDPQIKQIEAAAVAPVPKG